MKWILKSADTAALERLASALSAECGISPSTAPVLARLLLTRQIRTPEAAAEFLSPAVSQLHSPFLLRGLKDAVDRLDAAIERKEAILVYGDYDVDGTTAIVIL